ncbi:hypothetical protein [Streptomyces lycii]|uniref:DUF4386 domain-containing protein n=1 Tax=Streptomyces lycii TaxID=2654337 RepID=A0ABQ7FLJ3_9ACTN|nr:hypothetical protein [Streptomyces lycii]KAF4408636.1 hypothetical protein GCU69_13130 [Streptomyces lycii]
MKLAGYALAAYALVIGIACVTAWAVMILVGVWHGMRPAVPAIGFGEALIVAWIAGLLVAPAAASRGEN